MGPIERTSQVAVSIVVPTFRPGAALQRVFDSIDALTLPVDEVEVIFVDDGSGDDTVDRVQAYAATRPNTRVLLLENSGWPSRPRNLAVDEAVGEYVFFMDHDDTLYPDGLRRALHFARAHDADVVSPKESKTNDVWWGVDSLSNGNLADIRADHDVERLHEMIPHKLYRRRLLQEHAIRFPERPRALWEDWIVNVSAYRHARTVAVLADTPVYLWHGSDENTSHSFDPAREDFWDRLDDLFDHLVSTLDEPEFAVERTALVRHNVYKRAVHRLSRMLTLAERADPAAEQRAFTRSRELLERYGTAEILDALPLRYRALAHLISTGSVEQVRAYQLADESLQAEVVVSDLRWSGSVLNISAATTLRATRPELAALRRDGERIRFDPGQDLTRALPPELLDFTSEQPRADLAVRDRLRHVTWTLPGTSQPVELIDGAVLQHHASCLDVSTVACGAPLPNSVWDVRSRWQWNGIERRGPVGYTGTTVPALLDSSAVISYANNAGSLSIDSAQQLRTLAIDGVPAPGPAGPARSFSARLTRMANATGRLDAQLAVLAEDETPDDVERAAKAYAFRAEVVAIDGVARVVGEAELPVGDYRVYARRAGTLHRTAYVLTVDPAGRAHVVPGQHKTLG